MALIITAQGRIDNPAFQLPDISTGRYLAYDARDVVASNGATVAQWDATFRTSDTEASRAPLAPLAGVASPALPSYITNARGGIPALRFGGQAYFLAGYRSGGEPTDALLRKLPGQAVSYTTLARQRDLVPDANGSTHRLFAGSSPTNHMVRPGTSGAHRMIAHDNAGLLSPFIEMPGAVGNWFALTVVWDKPNGRMYASVNGGPLIEWTTTNQPAYWCQIGIGRAMGTDAVSAVGFDYARIEMHSRALTAADIVEMHRALKRDYGVTDF